MLVSRIEPHAEVISRFDRWARRVASAEAGWANREALTETAFSTVRPERVVLAAWVRRRTGAPLAFPPDAPYPEDTLSPVRVEGLGEVAAAAASIPRGTARRHVVLVAIERDGLTTLVALDDPEGAAPAASDREAPAE